MDDLLELVDFRRAVMKIDIEGQEHRAFFHADRLFDHISVGYIFMEWIKLRAFVAFRFSTVFFSIRQSFALPFCIGRCPVRARVHCRISPLRFLAKCRS